MENKNGEQKWRTILYFYLLKTNLNITTFVLFFSFMVQ